MKNSFLDSTIGRFRLVAILEGVSFLVLLGIAMPLKYFADMPLAVKYIGWVHGLLFVLFIVLLLKVSTLYKWGLGKVMAAFIASILPFGTFILDKKLKNEQQTVIE